MKTLTMLSLLLAVSSFAVGQPKVQPGSLVFIQGENTVDASNSDDEASYADFSLAIAAALTKKKVPVTVVTDPEKAQYIIQHSSSNKEDSTGTKVAKMAFGFGSGGAQFNGSFMVIERESTAVAFSYNVKKGNFQSAAEAFAKHFKKHISAK